MSASFSMPLVLKVVFCSSVVKIIAVPSKKVLKMTVAFDGSAYVGWQRQPNGLSIQEKIEEILKRLTGKRVVIEGSSRTDTGVHALGMVASFKWPKTNMSIVDLKKALNALLPEDVRVLGLEEVPSKFHARFSAKGKIYRYRILNADVSDPFRRKTVWFIHQKMNVRAMNQAAGCFVGKHDFSSVAANPGYERTTMVRHIKRCEVKKRGDEVRIEVEADGFLYKMVRTIVGTLVQVGTGKRDASSVKELIASKDRRLAGKTAPAHGLYLLQVKY
jgi:tRNA pseudouridine38-40 synthase